MEWVFFAVDVWDVEKHKATSSTIDGSVQVLPWQSDFERACRTSGPLRLFLHMCFWHFNGHRKWPLDCIFTEIDDITVLGQERQTSEGKLMVRWGIAGSGNWWKHKTKGKSKILSWESGSINCSNHFNTFVLSYELCFTWNMSANNYITKLCTVVGKWKDVEYPNTYYVKCSRPKLYRSPTTFGHILQNTSQHAFLAILSHKSLHSLRYNVDNSLTDYISPCKTR